MVHNKNSRNGLETLVHESILMFGSPSGLFSIERRRGKLDLLVEFLLGNQFARSVLNKRRSISNYLSRSSASKRRKGDNSILHTPPVHPYATILYFHRYRTIFSTKTHSWAMHSHAIHIIVLYLESPNTLFFYKHTLFWGVRLNVFKKLPFSDWNKFRYVFNLR